MTANLIERRCNRCKTIYPATKDYFHIDHGYLKRICKKCKNKEQRDKYIPHPQTSCRKKVLHKYNNSNKGKVAQLKYRRTQKGKALSRRAKLKYYYNMTNDDYNKLFQQQNGCCAICGKHQSEIKRRLDIDHDHSTNKIRGLLCRNCNQHLGRFEKGRKFNPYLTQKFMEYLNVKT